MKKWGFAQNQFSVALLSKMLVDILVLLIPLTAVTVAVRTVGDVKRCKQEAFAVCMNQCASNNSDIPQTSWLALQACFDVRKAALSQCFSQVPESSRCIKWNGIKLNATEPHPTNTTESNDMQKGNETFVDFHERIPTNVQKPFGCLLKCQLKNHFNCLQGCAAVPMKSETDERQQIMNCSKGAQTQFDSCLKEKFQNR